MDEEKSLHLKRRLFMRVICITMKQKGHLL